MDFFQLLEKQAQDYPHKAALIFRDTRLTFKELKGSSFNVSCGLRSLGLKKADKIAVFLPNIPEYILSFLGIFLLRGVCVPLDFMLTEEEVVNFINHSESKALIAQRKKGMDLENIKNKCPGLKEIILFGEDTPQGLIPWKRLWEEKPGFQKEAADENDYSAIFYTSGSTGHPKGVLLTYGHLGSPVECVNYFLHPQDQDSFICSGVPFSHIGGLDYLLFMLYFGTTLVLMERFHPLEFLKNIEKYSVTIFCIVPSMYVAILSLKEYDKFNLSSLKYAVVFGAPSSPVLLEKFHKACPNAYLLNGWGMTETSAPNTYLPTGTNTKEIPYTGKFPPGTEAKIVDDRGMVLGQGQEGELWIRGKAVMAGYYKEPGLTEEAITEDGWLKTGDVARLDSEGRFSIVGRKKDMIKVSGEIVFSAEVEEAIQRHPKVREAAVIGITDKIRGEVPKAFVVPRAGEALDEAELRYFLRQSLAHFKIPHYIEFADDLPKNRTGKIDKEKLRLVKT
ncbi:MAG: class I adenylate-forming enzyme family protein [Candidatus Omnitrophota bacterium]